MPTIIKAVDYSTYGYIMLTVQPETGDAYEYALYPDDPYGDAPALRAELQRMVDAGEIVVEAAPAS